MIEQRPTLSQESLSVAVARPSPCIFGDETMSPPRPGMRKATLAFIPKIVSTFLVLILAGPWMLSQITSYAHDLLVQIPQLAGGG